MIRPVPAAERVRYYFHGDQCEDDPGFYYCALCDVFWRVEHFVEREGVVELRHSTESNRRRLEASRLTFARRVTLGDAIYRPHDAENILIGQNVVALARRRRRRLGGGAAA